MLVEKKNPFEGRINSSIALSSITTFRKKWRRRTKRKWRKMKRVLKKDAWISRWRENKNNFSRSFEHSSSFRSRLFVFFSFLKGDGRPEKKRMTDGVFHGWTRGWNLAENGGMALFNSLKLRFLRWDAVSRCVAGEFSLTKGGKRGKRGEGG